MGIHCIGPTHYSVRHTDLEAGDSSGNCLTFHNINNNNDNNNMSRLPRVASSVCILFSMSALQSYYYPGHRRFRLTRTHYAYFPLPRKHSSQASFLQAHSCLSNHINLRILPGTHLTPGWRVANVDQCLAKGH